METTPRFELKYKKSKFKKVKITSPDKAADFIREFYSDDIHIYESFFILLLDIAANTIGYAKISQGGVAGTVVDKRIIAKYAVDSLCSSVVLAHNHPSGRLTPSDMDIRMTKSVIQALELLDIKVFDHIILSPNDNEFLSMASEGII